MFAWRPSVHASISELEYAAKKRQTRRASFLAEIEPAVPWAALLSAIEPVYPRSEGGIRPPIGLETMLRMCIAQRCFGLPDEAIEDALCDRQEIRRFVGLDLARESAQDATTVLKFRRLPEDIGLSLLVSTNSDRYRYYGSKV